MGAGGFLVRAVGFFNDAYDLFVMAIVNVVMEHQYGDEYSKTGAKDFISTAVFVGSVLGQIVFGYFADRLGRKKIMIVTAALLIVGGILCTGVYAPTTGTMFILLALFRGLLGFGIGGEYPLSCTYTAESSTTANRGTSVSSTFSMQGVGQLAAAFLANILVQLLANNPSIGIGSDGKKTYTYDSGNLEIIWRCLFGFGTIPAILILYPRYVAEDSLHFKKKDMGDAPPMKMKLKFIFKHYGKRLIGTAGTWFLFDIVFYSQSIFSGTILNNKKFGDDGSLLMVTTKYLLLALAALPGYFVAIATIDKIGRRNMQIQGFVFMTIIFSFLGFFHDWIVSRQALFLILYGLTFFFSNFGPNTTTFLLPVEAFPTAIRATCHGFSAAMGKIGAVVGTSMFTPLSNMESVGPGGVFLVCAAICLVSIPVTWYCVEDRTGDLSLLDDELQSYLDQEEDNVRIRLSTSFMKETEAGVADIVRSSPMTEFKRLQ